jgi:type II secretory pathway pseudopilin PulG
MRKIAILPIVALTLIALAGCSGNKAGNAANTAASAAAGAANAAGNAASGAANTMSNAASSAMSGGTIPNCGAVKAVWVNLKTKVYHEPDDPAYGKTKHGEYLCPSQAAAQGFHKAGSGKHHKSNSKM